MKKRFTVWLLATLFLANVSLADAQQPKKFLRIGYLSNTNPSTESARSEAVGQRLRELGYVEGQNVSIDYRSGEGNRDRAPKLAAELVALNCDVIVVFGGVFMDSSCYGCDQDDSYRYDRRWA
jgi:putative tryptophan/tyrosine transport system substrate-binding protein